MKLQGKSILLDDSSEDSTSYVGIGSETETTFADSTSETRTAIMESDLSPREIPLETSAAPSFMKETNKTVLMDGDPEGSYCVGWLLCISGPMKGNSYSLKVGRNSVGRSSTNAVCLPNDDGISRESQVYVVYDDDLNEYTAVPGSGSAVTRLNSRPLHQYAAISLGDIITLSKQTSLRFVPACDDNFRWNS